MEPGAAKLILSEVPDEKKFVCSDGTVFRTIEELPLGLKVIGQDVFRFHVNDEKNDFSTWIYDTIGDVKLAESIRGEKNMKAMIRKIKARITDLKKNVNRGV